MNLKQHRMSKAGKISNKKETELILFIRNGNAYCMSNARYAFQPEDHGFISQLGPRSIFKIREYVHTYIK